MCSCISLISFIFVFYSQGDSELDSPSVHMMIPWFSAYSRSNAGHNPLCVSLSTQSSEMTETEEHGIAQCLQGRTVETCYFA